MRIGKVAVASKHHLEGLVNALVKGTNADIEGLNRGLAKVSRTHLSGFSEPRAFLNRGPEAS